MLGVKQWKISWEAKGLQNKYTPTELSTSLNFKLNLLSHPQPWSCDLFYHLPKILLVEERIYCLPSNQALTLCYTRKTPHLNTALLPYHEEERVGGGLMLLVRGVGG